jgi:uncharacterized protein YndB with AHSA1/START domain
MVANEVVLPVDRDTAWELLTDETLRREWLGEEWGDREAIVEEAEPGAYLSWWWDDGRHGSRVEVVLSDAVGGTRVSVTETPVAAPMALALA